MVEQVFILCIGDSHTAGYPFFDPLFGGDPESSYEHWLSLLLTEEFPTLSFILDNRGMCGQTSTEIYNRLSSLLTDNNYDLVVFWAGANDIAVGYSIQTIWENMKKAYELTSKSNSIFMLVTIPPMTWFGIGNTVSILNKRIKDIILDNYYYVDVYSVLKENNKLKAIYDVGDGVHLSTQGYQRVGEKIFESITPIIKSLLEFG
jgi:lysophospholipase L1-like esterase